jgi:glycerate kinase
MRVLIACDKFKGSLTAVEACEAVARGLTEPVEIWTCPIADGGEGFVAAMLAGSGGRAVSMVCHDPLGRPVEAAYGICKSREGVTAFIEMAAASGLARLGAGERDLRRSSSYGTGEMMRHAVEVSGATNLVVGIGGSATNDGGAGMAAALGVRFLDDSGTQLSPHPADLVRLAAIDESQRIALPETVAACDVDNPLTGARGAAAVFGPQKGATPQDVLFLDEVLNRLAAVAGAGDLALAAGAGAAGGLGFGLQRFAGARLVPGFTVVAESSGILEKIAMADLVITGEGSLDSQTLGGKGPHGVALAARAAGVPVVAVAGRTEAEAAVVFDLVLSLDSLGLPLEECMARAGELVTAQVRAHAGLLRDLASR